MNYYSICNYAIVNGKKCDVGRIEYFEKDKKIFEYYGEIKNEMKNGYGRIYDYDNKTIYIGYWKDNMHYGYGKKNALNGDKYEGEWVNHKPHGNGTKISSNGDTTIGKWKYGKVVGKFTVKFRNGNTFTGKRISMLQYYGDIKYSDGNIYRGFFDNKFERHGCGRLTFIAGNNFYGIWRHDKIFRIESNKSIYNLLDEYAGTILTNLKNENNFI